MNDVPLKLRQTDLGSGTIAPTVPSRVNFCRAASVIKKSLLLSTVTPSLGNLHWSIHVHSALPKLNRFIGHPISCT